MLKYNEEYFPSVNVYGEWYFIIKEDGKINAVPHRPKKGLTLDKATSIENEYKSRVFNEIPKVVLFTNKLINEPLEEIKAENKHEESVIQYFLNKLKDKFKKNDF